MRPTPQKTGGGGGEEATLQVSPRFHRYICNRKKKTTVEWSGPVVVKVYVVVPRLNLGLIFVFFVLIWLLEDRGLLRCNDKT